ncbi:O-antigen ligase family protein [Mycolicibacterium llatzerense]|uniref:O-antigen ligase family protein n=1 Tax=Mycolicibacterium llatzerense TaxID=280871 RepID=UPI0008DCADBB|nr:O-antigen ligase family protein [Mycolicibacterium llatzerense]
MVVAEVANISELATQYTSAPLFKASVALGALTLVLALRDPVARARLNRWTAVGAALITVYIAGQVIALVGSVDVADSKDVLWRSAVDLAFLMIILMLTQVTGKPWAVAMAIAGTLAFLSVLSIASYLTGGHQTFGGLALISAAKGQLITTQRYGGPYGDSNFWGRLLVLGLPMAWALTQRTRRAGKQLLSVAWLGCSGLMLVGAYLTQSRGTLMTVGVAVALWFVASGRPMRLALIPPVVLSTFAIPGIGDRMVALVNDVFGEQRRYDIDPSVLGREASQEMAWQMFRQRPVFGFGPGTFGDEVTYYTDRVTTAVNEGLVAPHNLYAQFLAESGVIGLITWLVMVTGIFAIVALRIASDPRSDDRALAAAALTGIITWSVASVFLHLAYFRGFAIVLALACALGPPEALQPKVIRKVVRIAALWSLAVVAGAAVAGGSLLAATTPAVRASQKVIMMPVGPLDGWASYAMNVRSRAAFLPTMAEVMTNTDAPADLATDPVRGIITVSVTASDDDSAKRNLANALAVARTRIHDHIGPMQYTVKAITDVHLEHTSLRSKVALLYAAGWGLAVTLFARLLLGLLAARIWPRATVVPTESVAAPA